LIVNNPVSTGVPINLMVKVSFAGIVAAAGTGEKSTPDVL
jgi:hypothetical protein